jgi:ABC-type glutathione transport system ATPase component
MGSIEPSAGADGAQARGPLVEVSNLSKSFERGRGLWRASAEGPVLALRQATFAIGRGRTLALVGESGSGKSTLARCLALAEPPTTGEYRFDGKILPTLRQAELRPYRRRIQLMFQDTAGALSPHLTAIESVEEPLLVAGGRQLTGPARRERALEALEEVGLSSAHAHRRPLELSGGQRQRLALARALALKPEFLILDEALAGLDLSIQAQILNLLIRLQAALTLTYLFITHDLSLVSRIADEVAVMWRGEIVEHVAPLELFQHPRHPHTRELVKSLMMLDPAS